MAFDLGSDLGGKLGPAPVWLWIAGGAGVVVALSLFLKKRSAASSASGTPTPVSAVNPFLFGTGTGEAPSALGTTPIVTPDPTQIAVSGAWNPLTGGQGLPYPSGPAAPLGAQNTGPGTTSGSPLGLGWYQPGSSERGILRLGVDSSGIVAVQDATGAWIGQKYLNPQADWQVRANQAISSLMSSTPSSLPVTDIYGRVGLVPTSVIGNTGSQPIIFAPAGTPGLQNGSYILGQPIASGVQQPNPYGGPLVGPSVTTSGTFPDTGSIQGTGQNYMGYTPGAVNPIGQNSLLEFAGPQSQTAPALSPWGQG